MFLCVFWHNLIISERLPLTHRLVLWSTHTGYGHRGWHRLPESENDPIGSKQLLLSNGSKFSRKFNKVEIQLPGSWGGGGGSTHRMLTKVAEYATSKYATSAQGLLWPEDNWEESDTSKALCPLPICLKAGHKFAKMSLFYQKGQK